MPRLVIHPEKISDPAQLQGVCPFGAIDVDGTGAVSINAACKMCRLCVKKGPAGAVTLEEDAPRPAVDKSLWRGVLVYVEHSDGEIHPVTYELIGKAMELARVVRQPVYALMLGHQVTDKCRELLHYGVDQVHVYDQRELSRFKIDAYCAAFCDAIETLRPAAILVGATTVGRQLAPRVAARMRTGLTADCTALRMEENTDLIQIRPAFGGNIMAQIFTPNHRPQMATVRYKVMDAPARRDGERGEIVAHALPEDALKSVISVLEVRKKPAEQSIEGADILVVAGRGVKKQADLVMIQDLCGLMGAQLACTRPMVEAGWVEARRQVGLSGRTVRPKLILTLGVSGAIQFVAGMDHSETIAAVNTDAKAPIFKAAHYALVGDLYQIVPRLIQLIQNGKGA